MRKKKDGREPDDTVKRGHGRSRIATLGSTILFAAVLSIAFGLSAGPANAAPAPQCNGVGEGGGQGIECTVEVVNTLDNSDPSAPVTSSTVTVTTCLGAAGAARAGLCTSSGPITSPTLTTAVNQCNYAVNGGGATLLCTVSVINNVIGVGTVSPATTNQCNNSLDTGDVLNCNPYPSTTNPATAAIVQCNDSDNGGGSVLDCAVDPASTVTDLLPVTVNQCNNSANGGGSTVTCRTRIVSAIVAPAVPTPVVSPPPTDNGPVTGTSQDTSTDTGGTAVGDTAATVVTAPVLANTGENAWLLVSGAALLVLFGGVLTVGAARLTTSGREKRDAL